MEPAGKGIPLENNIQPQLEEDALQRDLKELSSLHSRPCWYHVPAPVWWPLCLLYLSLWLLCISNLI